MPTLTLQMSPSSDSKCDTSEHSRIGFMWRVHSWRKRWPKSIFISFMLMRNSRRWAQSLLRWMYVSMGLATRKCSKTSKQRCLASYPAPWYDETCTYSVASERRLGAGEHEVLVDQRLAQVRIEVQFPLGDLAVRSAGLLAQQLCARLEEADLVQQLLALLLNTTSRVSHTVLR